MFDAQRYIVRLLGLDIFDPTTNEVASLEGDDVPCWLLDTDYNDLCFHVSQAFFPRTGAWENLLKALKADYEESVWDHLNGANALHFVRDADVVLARLAELVKLGGSVVLVEYDRRSAIQWVPYPIPITRLPSLASAAGLSQPVVTATRPSAYQGKLYVASAKR